MTNFLFGLASPIAYLFIFGFLILCGVGNPVPEDTVLIAAGYLAYSEVISLKITLPLAYIGVLSGDLLLYYFGQKYGQKIIEHPKFLKIIPVERVDKIRRGFKRWGSWMVFFARFLVGFRSPTFLLSGVMHMPFRRFIVFDCLGALISVPIFVGLGYIFGAHVEALRHDIGLIKHWVVAVVIVLIAIFFMWRWFRSRKEDVELKPIFLWKEEGETLSSKHNGEKIEHNKQKDSI